MTQHPHPAAPQEVELKLALGPGALDALLVDAHGLVRIGPARDDLRGPALVEVRVRVRIY